MSIILKNFIYNTSHLENLLHKKLIATNFYQKIFMLESINRIEDREDPEPLIRRQRFTKVNHRPYLGKNSKIISIVKKQRFKKKEKLLRRKFFPSSCEDLFDTYSTMEYGDNSDYFSYDYNFIFKEGYSYKSVTRIAADKDAGYIVGESHLFFPSRTRLEYLKNRYKSKLKVLYTYSIFSTIIPLKVKKGGIVFFHSNFKIHLFLIKKLLAASILAKYKSKSKNLLTLINIHSFKSSFKIIINLKRYKKKKKFLIKKVKRFRIGKRSKKKKIKFRYRRFLAPWHKLKKKRNKKLYTKKVLVKKNELSE
jgi:hypothetical protein